MDKIISGIVAGLAGICSFCFGRMDYLLIALIAMVVIDYITGIIGAIATKDLNSKKGFAGIAKKVLIFAIVAIAHIIGTMVFGADNSTLRDCVIAFYITMECISILENAGKIGLPIPQKLLDVLAQLQGKEED